MSQRERDGKGKTAFANVVKHPKDQHLLVLGVETFGQFSKSTLDVDVP